MVDKVTQANKKIAAAAAKDTAKKLAAGPVGTKMMEMMDVPSFAKGLTPQMLIDLAKSKNIITKEQQADFKNRVGKDRTALAQFNEMVTEADEPRLAYKGQSPAQIEMLRAKTLMPATSINKTQRISVLKDTHTLLNEAAAMDAPKEVKEKVFLEGMRKKFGDFADNPIVRKIAGRALMILGAFPTALDFIPMSLLEQDMGILNRKPEPVAKGGMMNINEITKPIFGYREFGEVGIRERIYDMLAPNEKMSDEELRLQNINPSSVLSEERPKAEGRPEGVLQGLFRELIGAKKAEGSDLSSMAATEILKLNEEIKLLRIDEMLNPEKDNSKAIQGKMNLREYYESLGN